MLDWLFKEQPERLQPAAGVLRGVILGAIAWVVLLIAWAIWGVNWMFNALK
jgi:hypothetical protein